MTKQAKRKNKWLAAGLNIIPGFGYLYLGVRKPFTYLLLSVCVIYIVGGLIDPEWMKRLAEMPFTGWDVAVMIVSGLAFMVDAYFETPKR